MSETENNECNIDDDTIKLLRECNAGIKMGIDSLDDMVDKVQSEKLKKLILESKDTHCRLGDDAHEYLTKYHDDGKEPAAMAKMMAKVKGEMKMMTENPDQAAADVLTDGCNMGVKSLHKYLNKYPAANDKVKALVKDVIKAEDTFAKSMREFL